ncbi:MAG: ribonuclease J [Bacilli bacterium]|nr:ribonuclease J [Bacilli bacterium]
MNEHIHVFMLGGLDEDGKNLTVIEIDDDIFVLDAGIKYPDKSTPGIDYIISDYSYLKENKKRIKAYIITHGHDDQLGAIAYMVKDCPAPIYCSDVTKMLIESFLSHVNSEANLTFNVVKPTSDEIISGHTVHFFATCHNMPRSFGVAIETSAGNIIYTGDFIIENNSFKNFSYDSTAVGRIAEKPTLLLMCESTYATRPGYTTPNHRLIPHLVNFFEHDAKGRIFISVFATNAFAIAEIIKLSIMYNRKICAYDKETYALLKRLESIDECAIPRNYFLDYEDINRVKDTDLVILMTGFGRALYTKMNRFAKGSGATRIAFKETDTFIVAAPTANYFEVLGASTLDNLFRTGMNVHNVSRKEYLSMHPSEEDIKSMISLFRPKFFVPIKGSYRNMIANAMIAYNMGVNLSHNNIFVLENGLVLDINNEAARMLPASQAVPTGIVLINGKNLTSSANEVLSERLKLGEDGVVLANVAIDSRNHKIISVPEVNLFGVTCLKDIKTVSRLVSNELTNILNEFLLGNYNKYVVESAVTDRLSKLLRKEIGKEPLVVPIITDIN